MDQLHFAFLAAALAVFLLSTGQFALKWRALIWFAGASLTGVAIWIALSAPNPASFLETAIRYPGALLQALGGNWKGIGGALPPMFDMLCIATCLIAIGCLVAFTPGDAAERVIRPINIALIGALGGALAALAIAGVGFGGAVKRKVYVGVVTAADVYDGDTIIMGDTSLRLWGIDASEKRQPCLNEAKSCGAKARDYLAGLVEGQLLVCKKPNGADGELRETFGRPLVECTRQHDGVNIGQAMVVAGCADPFRDNGKTKSNYENDRPTGGGARICEPFQAPEDWREHR